MKDKQEKTISMPKMGLSGHVKVQVINPDDSVEWESDFSNLILDQGLDEIAARAIVSCMEHCAVGTGNSTPANTQTGLDNEIARTDNYLTGIGNSYTFRTDTGTTPALITHRRTFDFPEGTLDSSTDGDYQEVGFSWSGTTGTNLFSRALIKDEQGNPVAVTVDSDQILRIIYNLQIDCSPAEAGTTPTGITDSFDIANIGTINGKHLLQVCSNDDTDAEGNIVVSLYRDSPFGIVNKTSGSTSLGSDDAMSASQSLEPSRDYVEGSGNSLVILSSSNTDIPSGFSEVFSDSSKMYSDGYNLAKYTQAGESGRGGDYHSPMTVDEYTSGTFSVTKTVTIPVSEANYEWSSLLIRGSSRNDEEIVFYRFDIDDTSRFTKEDTHTLTISLVFSWGRA